jgi:hypothetical protein
VDSICEKRGSGRMVKSSEIFFLDSVARLQNNAAITKALLGFSGDGVSCGGRSDTVRVRGHGEIGGRWERRGLLAVAAAVVLDVAERLQVLALLAGHFRLFARRGRATRKLQRPVVKGLAIVGAAQGLA